MIYSKPKKIAALQDEIKLVRLMYNQESLHKFVSKEIKKKSVDNRNEYQL